MIEFTVFGNPKKQGRHRSYYNEKLKQVMTYKDKNTKKDEQSIQMVAVQNRPEKLIEGPIILNIVFYMSIPKGTSKKKKLEMFIKEVPHMKRPDLSNLIKLIEDACNGIIYRDDSQIFSYGNSRKIYGEVPRTEIKISEIYDT